MTPCDTTSGAASTDISGLEKGQHGRVLLLDGFRVSQRREAQQMIANADSASRRADGWERRRDAAQRLLEEKDDGQRRETIRRR